MNPGCRIVTDSEWNLALLRRALRAEVDTGVVQVSRSDGVVSSARTVLLTKRIPVLLVVDARTTDPGVIAERRDFLEFEMRAARTNVPSAIVIARPNLGVCLFEDPTVLPSVGIADLSDVARTEARFQPNVVLSDRLRAMTPAVTPEEWVSRLPDDAVESIRNTSLFKQILEAIARFEPAAAAS